MKEYIPIFRLNLGCLAIITCLITMVSSSMAEASPSYEIEKTLTGKVTDEDGLPLPGVNVVIKNTTKGTVTDANGNYTIEVPDDATVLVFSFVGYNSQEVQIGAQNVINVSLIPDTQQLQEIVVVGYGTQKRSDITGSVYSIPEERLKQLPNNNIAQALQGAIPGLSISANGSSAEGNNVAISIRGRSSINASNTPLIVLDGIIYEGAISDINTTDIKSMEVLKDASSTAIYGSRGANGVILITTKKGQAGKVNINYDFSFGVSDAINIPDILTPEEFYNFKVTRDSAALTATEDSVYRAGIGVDWLDEALRTGKRTQHALSVSGGSDKIQYYVSAAYLKVEGIAVGDKFDRYSLRTNLSADLTDWLTLSTNTQFSMVDRSGLNAGFTDAFYMNPLTYVRDENNDLVIRPWPEDPAWNNPLSDLNAVNENLRYKLFSNNSINVKVPFVKGLEYKLNTGVEFTYNPTNSYYGRNTGRGFESNGESVVGHYDEHNYLVENILSYKRQFDKHNLFLTALYSYQTFERKDRSITGTLFPTDFLTTYQNEVAGLIEPSDSYERWDLISSMFRVNYGYDDRYLITLTARRDGYSAFGANNKFGIFPSAAVAWNIHNESFFNSGLINSLKFRLSYGLSGNQSVDPYSSLALLNERSYINGQNVAGGYIPFSLGTPDLSWETSKTANIGVDFGVAKSRITGSLDYYVKNTTDLLLQRTISLVHGSQRDFVYQNIGEVQNKGIELGLKADVVQTSDFLWNAQLTASYNKNEIVDLYGNQKSDTLNRWFIGKPIEVNYHYVFDGVYQLNDDIDDTPQGSVEAGWAKIKDVNGDGKITADGDYVIQGQTDPKFIFGLGNTFTYKGVSLYVFIQGVTGVTRRNPFLRDDVFDEVRRNTTKKQWWTGERPTNSYWSNSYDSNQFGVQIFEDASFLRVKDISLSYNVPMDLIQKIGLSSLKIYTSARNLLTFTDYEGLDPEFPESSNRQRSVPLQREFIFGLNVGF